MKKETNNAIIYMIFGVVLVMLGVFAIIQQSGFIMQVFDLIGWIFVIQGAKQLYDYYIKKCIHKLDIPVVVLDTLGGFAIILYTDIPMYLATMIFALYVSINGIVRFFIYLNYKRDKVVGRVVILLVSLFLIFNGIAMFIAPSLNVDIIARIIGTYACLLGIMYFKDGIFMVLPRQKKDILKRKIRISLPLFIVALVPKTMMDYINERLQVDDTFQIDNTSKDVNLEIFIHVSPDGFGKMGHCDICFDGEVISYGNYDYSSIRLFEAMGDGVMFITQKEKYLPFCIKEDNKTIFGYGLHLNAIQLKSVRDAIMKIKANAYPWFPPSYYDHSIEEDYASRLFLATTATFYKFKKGKFKSYFVLGTNCVLLAEEIVGKSGQDIINLNGIITPGTYQDYLEKEYHKTYSQVVSKNIYNKSSMVHK